MGNMNETQLLALVNNPVVPNLSPKEGNTGENAVTMFGNVVESVISVLLILGIVFFIFNFILGAIAWISSGGDKAKVEGSRQKVTQSIVGLLVMFSIFAVLKLIGKLFGFDILNLDLGSVRIK